MRWDWGSFLIGLSPFILLVAVATRQVLKDRRRTGNDKATRDDVRR